MTTLKLLGAVAAIAVLSTSALADKYRWAELTDQCLKQRGVGDTCYVADNFQVWCHDIKLGSACSAEANAALRPQRYSARPQNAEAERPRDVRRPQRLHRRNER